MEKRKKVRFGKEKKKNLREKESTVRLRKRKEVRE